MKVKTLFICSFFVFLACSSNDENTDASTGEIINEEVNLRIDHSYTTAVGLDLILTNRSQEGDEIGSSTWRPFYNSIEGFEYEHGYRYSLKVQTTVISNPPADASSINYRLIDVISKTPGPLDESFEIMLQIGYDTGGTQSFVTGTDSSSFKLLDSIRIDCSDLCDELSTLLSSGTTFYGTFTRKSNNSYLLNSVREE